MGALDKVFVYGEYDFHALLEESARVHGHVCPGQVLGVRMSMLGLSLVGISDPRGRQRKSFMVFVEIDRCATDAVQSVTGASLGKRSMKFMDYGKMAATFLNLDNDAGGALRAVRVVAREEARAAAERYFGSATPGVNGGATPGVSGGAAPGKDKYDAQLRAYKIMPYEELFYWMEVKVNVPPEDMPGRPIRRVRCDLCGEYVQDKRDVEAGGKTLCRPCAGGGYYEAV
jgi:formylmethanofuran dehydrogenase subunit E